jgi:hypothetical protein
MTRNTPKISWKTVNLCSILSVPERFLETLFLERHRVECN